MCRVKAVAVQAEMVQVKNPVGQRAEGVYGLLVGCRDLN